MTEFNLKQYRPDLSENLYKLEIDDDKIYLTKEELLTLKLIIETVLTAPTPSKITEKL